MFHHLQPYLNEVKTVIIPDLGAITITNPDTGETMFMAFLKHDDGKFAAYVAEKEGKDVDSVKQQLSAAVSEIQSRLNAEGKAEIAGFGSFVLQDGEIDFVTGGEAESAESTPEPAPEPAEDLVPEEVEVPERTEIPVVAPVEPPSEEPAAEPETEIAPEEPAAVPDEEMPTAPTPEETPIAVSEVPGPEVPTEPEAPADEPTKEVEAHVEEPAAPEVKEEVPRPIVPMHAEKTEPDPEMNILQKEQLAASQKKLDDLRKAKEAKPAKKKRGAGFWMLMALIAMLAVGGTLVGIYYDEVKKHVPFLADTEEEKAETGDELEEMEELLDEGDQAEEAVQEEENSEESPETVEETPVDVEPENVPEKTTPPPSNSSEMRWHLIAGTFSVEANAQRLADNLRKQGMNPTIRQVGAMYLVSAKGFPTREAALAGKSELGAAAAKSWLYEWK